MHYEFGSAPAVFGVITNNQSILRWWALVAPTSKGYIYLISKVYYLKSTILKVWA